MCSRVTLVFFGAVLATVSDGVLSAQYPKTPQQVLRTSLHGAAYVEGEPAPGPDETFKKEVRDALKEINRKLDKLLEDDPDGPPPGAAVAPTADVLSGSLASCLECHNAKDAVKLGDRFVMFGPADKDGRAPFREDFSRAELKRMEERVRDGTMPKRSAKTKLTPEGRDAILAELKARTASLDRPNP